MIEFRGHTFENVAEVNQVSREPIVALPAPPDRSLLKDDTDYGNPLSNLSIRLRTLTDVVLAQNTILQIAVQNERIRAAQELLQREHNPY